MLVALYKWTLLPGTEARFASAWSAMTRLVHSRHGSLGSRLHYAEPDLYLAYAQWPDQETYMNWIDMDNSPDEQGYIDIMNACINIKFEREIYMVTDDQLKLEKE